jgi:hypothetical protein
MSLWLIPDLRRHVQDGKADKVYSERPAACTASASVGLPDQMNHGRLPVHDVLASTNVAITGVLLPFFAVSADAFYILPEPREFPPSNYV